MHSDHISGSVGVPRHLSIHGHSIRSVAAASSFSLTGCSDFTVQSADSVLGQPKGMAKQLHALESLEAVKPAELFNWQVSDHVRACGTRARRRWTCPPKLSKRQHIITTTCCATYFRPSSPQMELLAAPSAATQVTGSPPPLERGMTLATRAAMARNNGLVTGMLQ
jgi:hypothetical protein